MAFKKAIKKIAALGAGLGMAGATLMGAMAFDLAEFPSPFVEDGVFNTLVVIGANAKTIDTIGAADIVAALQAASVSELGEGLMGTERGGSILTVSGDSVEIGEPSDLLELGEPVGNVRETITEFELDALKGGVITTDEGSTEYNQYLRFKDNDPTLNNVTVLFTENDETNEKVGDFLYMIEGNAVTDAVFEYELEFEEGLESEIEFNIRGSTVSTIQGELDDLEDEVFNLFGVDYTFVDSELDISAAQQKLTLEFLGGDVTDTLEEGEIRTYTIDGVDYEVEALIVSDTGGNEGRGSVKFKVNGEVTDELEDGETDVLSDGLEVGIREILPNEAEEVAGGDLVEFFLGANKIQFTDVYSDCNSATSPYGFSQGVEITSEDIEEGWVSICGSVIDNNKTFEITSIKYRLIPDARSGESDIYIPPGHGIREYLDEPEGMLNPEWDIRYEGLVDTGVSTVLIESRGDDEYKLTFTNRQGNRYVIPLVDNNNGNDGHAGTAGWTHGDFKLGDDVDKNNRNSLIFAEGVFNNDNISTNDYYPIWDDDMFILSDMDAEWDETSFTHVLVYESIDTSNKELTFEDLATGTQEVVYRDMTNAATWTGSGALGTGELVMGGNSFTFYVANDTTAPAYDDYRLVFDQNNDNDLGQANLGTRYEFGVERAKITIDGGGILDLEDLNCSYIEIVNNSGAANYNLTTNSCNQNATLNLVNGSARLNSLGAVANTGTTLTTRPCDMGVNHRGINNFINDTFSIILHTESSEFDENDGAEEICTNIRNEANNEVGLRVVETEIRLLGSGTTNPTTYWNSFTTDAPYDFELNEPDENEDFNLGMTAFGVFFSVFDEDQQDEPQELTIEYPLLQRGAHVFITAGTTKASRSAAGGAVVVNKVEVGKVLLDEEVADVTAQNAIVVGGPCVNTAAADLLGNPEDCAEGFMEGEAMIKLFANGDNVAMLVAGYSGDDTRQASAVIAEYEKYDLSGEEVKVNTQTLQVTTVS
ncbi:S-layer protein [Candidatus Woesearchaeota archaeon]|nr:S-layer protein [Candidatus Woesearchaeota archaeon]